MIHECTSWCAFYLLTSILCHTIESETAVYIVVYLKRLKLRIWNNRIKLEIRTFYPIVHQLFIYHTYYMLLRNTWQRVTATNRRNWRNIDTCRTSFAPDFNNIPNRQLPWIVNFNRNVYTTKVIKINIFIKIFKIIRSTNIIIFISLIVIEFRLIFK